MPTFNQQTTIQDVVAAYPGFIEGRTFLITGATNGLGFAFAKFVAQQGAGTVVLTGRSEEKLAKRVDEVKSAANTKTIVKSLLLDLESQDSIHRAAEQITSGALAIPAIDILLNNAGIMAVPYKEIDGCESQFFCNHISHFLFTNLILSHIASPGGRVINTTSGGHFFSHVRFEDHHFMHGWLVYNKWQGYGQSKTANILFGIGLTKRLKDKDIESFAVHPGIIMTSIGEHLDLVEEGLVNKDGSNNHIETFLSMDQGIATYMYAAAAPELKGKGGAYLTESQIKDPVRPMTEEDADKLWELSNSILGTKF
ncbi:hypothetical protein BDQ17DRAFT_1279178 [Cyathus striatus]|nr:hypothetical protein BDQ17DRAFT_1279178 [Cyathus striatus]